MNALAIEQRVYTHGAVTLDVHRRQLKGPRGEAILRDKLLALAEALFRGQGRFVTQDSLIGVVWVDPQDEPGLVDVRLRQLIGDLRAALRTVGTDHDAVRCERGVGYRLEARR